MAVTDIYIIVREGPDTPDQLEDLCIACYDYEPFEPFLEGEFGTSLKDYHDQMMFAEAGDEAANIT